MHPTISEEGQDTIMSSDTETGGPYTPPPRIAARIFKNTANRRKGSAASSRRNSLTSLHSSRSARSSHGGPLSTHIAQHLRRASIIESRKAKAADRNAHAEQVRLRAAMNKAAPRATTNSEARALAAQKTRDRYLAQVKANCAEEVKRSKRVAEEQREKRAAEHLRLKEEMEERHAEAERRKALLQRRPRTATNPQADESPGVSKALRSVWKPRTPAQAAHMIQRAWRKSLWRSTSREYVALDLNLDRIQRMEFESVGQLLSQEQLLVRTGKLLNFLRLETSDSKDAQEQVGNSTRTFLSLFMILGHPSHVLSNDSEQERDLLNQARRTLSVFNEILAKINIDPTSTRGSLRDLREAFASYQASFTTWRSFDSSFMVQGMVAQFVELDAIWQTVKHDHDGAVADDYKEGIESNQALVLAHLKKLVGPEKAMKMLRDAVRKNRKARAKMTPDPSINIKPRQAATVSTPGSTGSSSEANAAPGSQSSVSVQRTTLHKSSLIPPNRTISHEIAISREWRIDADARLAMADETVPLIAAEMQRSLDYSHETVWIPAMAESIRSKLLDLLTPGNSLHTLISGALDPALVANQVEHGSFSYETFFSFMNNILPQLCAPVRDADVKSLATNPSDDPIMQLARLSFMTDVISLDNLNFRLQERIPLLLEHSAGYEARCFEKQMQGVFPERTLGWWEDATRRTNEEMTRRAPETTPVSAIRGSMTASKVYMGGLVDLAIGTEPLDIQDVPETLELDYERLNRIRADILRIITVSSILLTAKNLLRRDVRSLWKAEAQRMWELPFATNSSSTTSTSNSSSSSSTAAAVAAAAYISIIESRYALPPTTKNQLTSTITRILTEAVAAASPSSSTTATPTSHPVMKVVLKKIRTHVLSRLAASSAEERIRTSTSATEVLGGGGLIEFVARIRDIVTELQKVADVDRQAHGEWYEKVAAKAEERERERQSEVDGAGVNPDAGASQQESSKKEKEKETSKTTNSG